MQAAVVPDALQSAHVSDGPAIGVIALEVVAFGGISVALQWRVGLLHGVRPKHTTVIDSFVPTVEIAYSRIQLACRSCLAHMPVDGRLPLTIFSFACGRIAFRFMHESQSGTMHASGLHA